MMRLRNGGSFQTHHSASELNIRPDQHVVLEEKHRIAAVSFSLEFLQMFDPCYESRSRNRSSLLKSSAV